MPFDIPIEAFAVEVVGGAHPSIRSLGSRRRVYVEHRQTLRRAYRRRQLVLAMGMAGAFVAVAAVALVPGGADASPPTDTRAEGAAVEANAPALAPAVVSPARRAPSVRPIRPNPPSRRHWGPDGAASAPAVRTMKAVAFQRPVERDEARLPPPYIPGWHGQPLAREPFLECTRQYESKHAGGYQAVSRGGQYRGAYQFDRTTWDEVARRVQRFDLVGVDPAAAVPIDQDLLASSLYQWKGAEPWAFRCAGLP